MSEAGVTRTGARAGPFGPRTVLALLLVGAAAFALLLYALGAGWTGRSERDGGAHAASPGLTGFAALAALLEGSGHQVSLSRDVGRLDGPALLVLTPPQWADGDELARIIERRRNRGPTLLILPKWSASPLPEDPRITAKPGWVALGGVFSPDWLGSIAGLENVEPVTGATRGWRSVRGLGGARGLAGTLPAPGQTQAIKTEGLRNLYPMMVDSEGDLLAAWRFDGGYYPQLGQASDERMFADGPEDFDEDAFPLVVVIEPDLLNNYGLADANRARAAVALVEASLGGQALPIMFDLTLPGLGRSRNLLSLAFEPPFLAATLCLLLAALAVAWRAFCRFGAARAELPELAHGKTQLAINSAGLIERTRRLHLLGAPFAAMVAARLAGRLGIRAGSGDRAFDGGAENARAAAIDRALVTRGAPAGDFLARVAMLRGARRPRELIRAAAALTDIERNLVQ